LATLLLQSECQSLVQANVLVARGGPNLVWDPPELFPSFPRVHLIPQPAQAKSSRYDSGIMHLKDCAQGCALIANNLSSVVILGTLDDQIGKGGHGLRNDVIAFYTLSSNRLTVAEPTAWLRMHR
jgi:hypothetical protein